MFIKHSTSKIDAVYDNEKKDWVKNEPEEKVEEEKKEEEVKDEEEK